MSVPVSSQSHQYTYKSSLEGFFVTNKRTAEVTVVRVPNNQPNIDLDRLNHIG